MPRPDRSPPPALDAPALERLALRYVERFATTRGKLAQYLARKLRERGWAEETPADVEGIAERMATLGYIDDRGYAAAKAGAMARRGLGARRVGEALRAAGVAEADRPLLDDNAADAALAFARRKRLGPFALAAPDRDQQARQIGQFLRAGHRLHLARRLLAMAPGEAAADGWED